MPEKATPVMENDNQLPTDFDGIFRFTNFTDKDFSSKWDGVVYTFPANKTVPLLIPTATPEQTQNIRKKFARDLATACFYDSERFAKMNNVPEGSTPALYTDKELEPYIQRCLEPLPMAQVSMKKIEKDLEAGLRTDTKGKKVSKVISGDDSLVGDGSVIA